MLGTPRLQIRKFKQRKPKAGTSTSKIGTKLYSLQLTSLGQEFLWPAR